MDISCFIFKYIFLERPQKVGYVNWEFEYQPQGSGQNRRTQSVTISLRNEMNRSKMEFDVVVDSYVKKVKCDYGILHVWILNFDLDTHIRNLLNKNKKMDENLRWMHHIFVKTVHLFPDSKVLKLESYWKQMLSIDQINSYFSILILYI